MKVEWSEWIMSNEASSVYNRPRISQEKASQAPFENGSHRIKKRSSIRENYYLGTFFIALPYMWIQRCKLVFKNASTNG